MNFLVTIIYMRAPGMGWNQLNIFVWTTFGAFMIQIVFVPVLAAAVTLLLLDKYVGTGFFDPTRGGDVLLYQNLFWFYSHPAVYVIFLPAVGLMFDIIATQAKNHVFNYKAAVYGGIIGIRRHLRRSVDPSPLHRRHAGLDAHRHDGVDAADLGARRVCC